MTLEDSIARLAAEFPVEKNWIWNVPTSSPVTLSEEDAFKRNIELKEKLEPELKKDTTLNTHYWVIQEWGGIKSFKRTQKNDELIRKFCETLQNGAKLSRPMYNVISSLSKVAAFWNPRKYSIYDSRAVFALNWLMFRYGRASKMFFQPSGRNVQLAAIDLNTIAALSGRSCQSFEWQEAYPKYCDQIQDLSWSIFEKPPYYLEMLLFVAAPTWVCNDIRRSVEVRIREESAAFAH